MAPFMSQKKPEDLETRLKELDEREKQIKLQRQVRNREQELGLRPKFEKPTWSKLMMVVVFAICIEIIIFSEVAMWKWNDLSALYTLIGVAATMVGTFWSYANKSKAENTVGGITYDTVMRQLEESMAASAAAIETNDDSTGVEADGEGVG